MTAISAPSCCACGATMNQRIRSWSYRCPRRHVWASSLDVTINEGSAIDEVSRELGLETIRHENNQRVLGSLNTLRPLKGARLLDIGSAHGWFIAAAEEYGASVAGIEPEEAIAKVSQVPNSIRTGFFPEVLGPEEVFDVISFNDVLEHLPDPAAAVKSSFAHLDAGGLLSISIPDNRGLAFRIAQMFARFGAGGAYDRLWQKGLQSPHLWYFNEDSLAELGVKSGFRVASVRHLPAVARSGLWHRIHMDRRPSVATRFQFVALLVLSPLLNSAPFSDILHIVLVRPAE